LSVSNREGKERGADRKRKRKRGDSTVREPGAQLSGWVDKETVKETKQGVGFGG